MATLFRLVASGSLDTTQSQIVFEEINDNTYLQFGLLDAENRRHLESVLAGGRVGFFESGQDLSDSKAPNARILDDYDAVNGIQIDKIPSELVVGTEYRIKWTQARPGESADATGISVDQGIVRFSTAVSGRIGERVQFSLDYRVVDRLYIAFLPRFYASPEDFDTDRPIPEDDPRYPDDVRIIPPLPFLTPGFYIHDIQLTPTYSGDLLISIDLLEEGTIPRPATGLFVVDKHGNAVIDANGNFVIENSGKTYNYETDVNGNFEVDKHNNRVLEIVING